MGLASPQPGRVYYRCRKGYHNYRKQNRPQSLPRDPDDFSQGRYVEDIQVPRTPRQIKVRRTPTSGILQQRSKTGQPFVFWQSCSPATLPMISPTLSSKTAAISSTTGVSAPILIPLSPATLKIENTRTGAILDMGTDASVSTQTGNTHYRGYTSSTLIVDGTTRTR